MKKARKKLDGGRAGIYPSPCASAVPLLLAAAKRPRRAVSSRAAWQQQQRARLGLATHTHTHLCASFSASHSCTDPRERRERRRARVTCRDIFTLYAENVRFERDGRPRKFDVASTTADMDEANRRLRENGGHHVMFTTWKNEHNRYKNIIKIKYMF